MESNLRQEGEEEGEEGEDDGVRGLLGRGKEGWDMEVDDAVLADEDINLELNGEEEEGVEAKEEEVSEDEMDDSDLSDEEETSEEYTARMKKKEEVDDIMDSLPGVDWERALLTERFNYEKDEDKADEKTHKQMENTWPSGALKKMRDMMDSERESGVELRNQKVSTACLCVCVLVLCCMRFVLVRYLLHVVLSIPTVSIAI